ncbi:hypothetical protein MKW98_022287, partial [Papaver atlanticum]
KKMLLLLWIINMYNAELFGRVFTANYALHEKIKGAEQGRVAQPSTSCSELRTPLRFLSIHVKCQLYLFGD